MIRSAVGFNKNASLLSGLRGTPNYGQAMAAQSQLSLESETANKKSGMQQKQQQNAREQKHNQQKSQTAGSNMRRDSQHKSHQIKQATAQSKNAADQIFQKRKKFWDDKNSAISALLS